MPSEFNQEYYVVENLDAPAGEGRFWNSTKTTWTLSPYSASLIEVDDTAYERTAKRIFSKRFLEMLTKHKKEYEDYCHSYGSTAKWDWKEGDRLAISKVSYSYEKGEVPISQNDFDLC